MILLVKKRKVKKFPSVLLDRTSHILRTLTDFMTANTKSGINCRAGGASSVPWPGWERPTLKAESASTVALTRASRASVREEVRQRSTAILTSSPTTASWSAAVTTSCWLAVTGRHSVWTRIRRSPADIKSYVSTHAHVHTLSGKQGRHSK